MTTTEHQAKRLESVACAVITVSDTRTETTDQSGRILLEQLTAAGHRVLRRQIIRDEPDEIRAIVAALGSETAIQAVVLTGGTGIAPRDGTIEAVGPLLDKRLDGFGELFRMLSFREVGAAALLSRAMAGVQGRQLVFVLPGSTAAVELAMNQLILPVLGHAAALLQR